MKNDLYLGRKWNPKTGRKGRRVKWPLRSHQTLLGPTSCGKGVTFEIPNLLMKGALYHSSVVSIDPTAQNYSVTWRWRSSFSDVVPLNPFDLLGTGDAGFNPLLTVRNYQEAAAIAECLQDMRADAREPFFQDMAALLLTGLILFEIEEAKKECRTPTLENVVGLLNGDLPATAQKMVDSGDFQLTSIGGRFLQDNRTTQGIVATAAASTRWLLSDEMRRSLSVANGFDMARLKGPRRVSLFVILDADKLATFGGWLRLVVVSALNTLYRLGGGGLNTVFMLSEFAQLGKMQPVIAALGQGRKYGIRLAPMVLQDMGQLSAIYGPHGATTVIGNSGCLFAFTPGPLDNETSEFLSRAAGSQRVMGLTMSDDPQTGEVRGNITEKEERLWPPEKIRSVPEFHGLVWRSGKAQPEAVYCAPYWELRELRGRFDPDPYHPAPAGGSRRRVLRSVMRATAGAALAAVVALGAVMLLHPSALHALAPPVFHHPARSAFR